MVGPTHCFYKRFYKLVGHFFVHINSFHRATTLRACTSHPSQNIIPTAHYIHYHCPSRWLHLERLHLFCVYLKFHNLNPQTCSTRYPRPTRWHTLVKMGHALTISMNCQDWQAARSESAYDSRHERFMYIADGFQTIYPIVYSFVNLGSHHVGIGRINQPTGISLHRACTGSPISPSVWSVPL